MSHFLRIVLCILLASCSPLARLSENLEESHYALYQQEALLVMAVEGNQVWLMNPTYTRCYFLKGRSYVEKWSAGDTMIIEENLDDFYRLKPGRDCSHLHKDDGITDRYYDKPYQLNAALTAPHRK